MQLPSLRERQEMLRRRERGDAQLHRLTPPQKNRFEQLETVYLGEVKKDLEQGERTFLAEVGLQRTARALVNFANDAGAPGWVWCDPMIRVRATGEFVPPSPIEHAIEDLAEPNDYRTARRQADETLERWSKNPDLRYAPEAPSDVYQLIPENLGQAFKAQAKTDRSGYIVGSGGEVFVVSDPENNKHIFPALVMAGLPNPSFYIVLAGEISRYDPNRALRERAHTPKGHILFDLRSGNYSRFFRTLAPLEHFKLGKSNLQAQQDLMRILLCSDEITAVAEVKRYLR